MWNTQQRIDIVDTIVREKFEKQNNPPNFFFAVAKETFTKHMQ